MGILIDSPSITIKTNSPRETQQLGEELGGALAAGDVVGLVGELGTGKTCLTQGIARGLGVPAGTQVCSPTFTIINEYGGRRLPLYHIDLYRVSAPRELQELGLEEYLEGDGVCVIEWFERLHLPPSDDHLTVEISFAGARRRHFTLAGRGERQGSLLAKLRSSMR